MEEKRRRSTAYLQREHYERYRAAFPEIKRRLLRGGGLRELSDHVAAEHDVDLKTAYSWVLDCEQRLERNRKRSAVAGIVLLWAAFGAAVAGGALIASGAGPGSTALLGLSAAAACFASAAVLLAAGAALVAGSRAFSRWLTARR